MPSKFDAFELAPKGIRNLSPYNPGKPIEELEREYGITDSIKLASNENCYGPSPKVRRVIQNELSELHMYPDGAGFSLKRKLASHLGVHANQITLGNGSNDVLDMVTRVFVDDRHSGIISEHAFIVYYLSLVYVRAEIRIVPAVKYGNDLQAIADAIDSTSRIVFIANPNNPTGTWSKEDELKHFLGKVPRSVIVVIDEAYAEYVSEPEYPDCIKWLSEYPNLIVTRTFSKIYGLANLRIGYAVASPEITELLNRVRQPFNCNGLAMTAAVEALNDQEYAANCRAKNKEQMSVLVEGFGKMGLEVIPSVANFLSVDLKRPVADAYEFLLRAGIIVRPIGGYQMPNHLRVSVGTEAENQRVLGGFQQLIDSGLTG